MPDAPTGSEAPVLRTASGATARWHGSADAGPVLVTWPALGVPAAPYGRFARAAAATGLTVVTADYRGQGDSDLRVTRDSRFGYRELAGEDLRDVVLAVRDRAAGRPVHLVCHSLGGQLAAALEADHPGCFDGLVLAAAGTPHWRAYPGWTRAIPLVSTHVLLASARLRGVLDSKRLGRQPATLVADWARMARTGSWARGGHRTEPRRFPLLAVSFEGDSLAPRGAVDALCRLFPGADVTRRHLSEPRGHAGWLREPDALVAALRAWLDDREADRP